MLTKLDFGKFVAKNTKPFIILEKFITKNQDRKSNYLIPYLPKLKDY